MGQNRQHDSNPAESTDRAPGRVDDKIRLCGAQSASGSVPGDSHQQNTSIPHDNHLFCFLGVSSCVCNASKVDVGVYFIVLLSCLTG